MGAKGFARPPYEVHGSVLGEAWVREQIVGSSTTSIKKQLVESNTKTAQAKQQAEQVLVVMASNYKKA